MLKINSGYTHFLLTGAVTLLLLSVFTEVSVQATNYAETARGADVYVLSDTQMLAVGEETTIDILVTNDTTPLNAIETELYFDPELFTVTDITFHSELCEERFIIDRTVDNTLGHIHLSCGTATPFSGNVTIFGTVTIIPLETGIGKIEFGEKTHIYVHDGLGTQIVRDTYAHTFVITNV